MRLLGGWIIRWTSSKISGQMDAQGSPPRFSTLQAAFWSRAVASELQTACFLSCVLWSLVPGSTKPRKFRKQVLKLKSLFKTKHIIFTK